MPVSLEGALADRSRWRIDNCSIAMAMEVLGARSTMLILREALYGTRRFDDFVRRTHSTDAIVASRLRRLTELGILAKQPYREAGKRTRDEYCLTAKGRDLLPVVIEARSADGRSLDMNQLALVANFPIGEAPEDRNGLE